MCESEAEEGTAEDEPEAKAVAFWEADGVVEFTHGTDESYWRFRGSHGSGSERNVKGRDVLF